MKFLTLTLVASVAAQDLDFSSTNNRESFGAGNCRDENHGSPVDIKSAEYVKDKYLPNLTTDGDWKGEVTNFQNHGQSIKFAPSAAVGAWAKLPVIKKLAGVTHCDYTLTGFEYLAHDSWHTISGSRSKAELVVTFGTPSNCDTFVDTTGPNNVLDRNAGTNVADRSTPAQISMSILIKTGDANQSLKNLAAGSAAVKNANLATTSAVSADFDISNFLKASEWKDEYYLYNGAPLPTTGTATCTKDTLWIVQHNKAEAKKADIEAFHTYTQVGGATWDSIKNMHAEDEEAGTRQVLKSFKSGGGFSFWG